MNPNKKKHNKNNNIIIFGPISLKKKGLFVAPQRAYADRPMFTCFLFHVHAQPTYCTYVQCVAATVVGEWVAAWHGKVYNKNFSTFQFLEQFCRQPPRPPNLITFVQCHIYCTHGFNWYNMVPSVLYSCAIQSYMLQVMCVCVCVCVLYPYPYPYPYMLVNFFFLLQKCKSATAFGR